MIGYFNDNLGDFKKDLFLSFALIYLPEYSNDEIEHLWELIQADKDKPLSEFIVKSEPDRIADVLFPAIPVPREEDHYYIFNRNGNNELNFDSEGTSQNEKENLS